MTRQKFELLEDYLSKSRRRNIAFARFLTGNAEDAEDLLQDAQVRAFRALEKVQWDEVPDAWFRQIIRNCFIDAKRVQSRRPPTTSLEALQEVNPTFDLADPTNEFQLNLEDKIESRALRQAVEKLKPAQRALVLAALNGTSRQELSEIFRCGAITVRTRLHRAHRSLRHHLMTSRVGTGINLRHE